MATPAPDYDTLYNVEDPFEDACKLIWAERDTGIPSFAQREVANLPGERLDFHLELGDAFNGHENAWNAQLHVIVWTRREPGARSKNGALRGAVRNCFRRVPVGDPEHPEFTEERLPLHLVNKLNAAGTSKQMNDDDLDSSELHFDVVVSVREGAFPLEPEP
jgi:hypothetical protein